MSLFHPCQTHLLQDYEGRRHADEVEREVTDLSVKRVVMELKLTGEVNRVYLVEL